jgi:uncharacterized pyridoxamine 5'-phosphate oxidase family protein
MGHGKEHGMRILAVCAVVVGFASIALSKDELKCPVSGKEAKETISLDVNGEKVYFCCENCPKSYKQKINLAEEEGEKKCALEGCGKAASGEEKAIVRTAKNVAFCCDNCPKAFARKNKFEAKDDGPKACPLSGKTAVNEEGTSLVVNGAKVYFCCKNCPTAYKKKLGATAAAEKTCPISGKPTDEATAQVFVQSKSVFFCCANCKKEYAAKHFEKGTFIDSKEKAKEEDTKKKL